MTSSANEPSGKAIVDSIHGNIRLSAREVGVIDTASFQRLRQLKQLQMGHVTYPNATHTRFAHSLGALGIMIRIIEVAKEKLGLNEQEEEDLRLAALLHDVGHYPYCHLMEYMHNVILSEELIDDKEKADFGSVAYPRHEQLGRLIITNQEKLREAIGGEDRAKAVADLFSGTGTKNRQLAKLISSSVDLDRMDYMLRDSHAAGVPYGNIDINYLLNNLQVSPNGLLGFSKKAMPAVEHFLLARFFLHQTVYYHKTTFALEEAYKQLLFRIRRARAYGIPIDGTAVEDMVKSEEQLMNFTDSYVDGIVKKAAASDKDPVIKALANSIIRRRPPKRLAEVQICEPKGRQEDHGGTTFTLKCRYELKNLAEKFDIPLEQFLFCRTPPLRIESRGQFVTETEGRQLPPEEEDEVVKIFIPGEDEPKSLVDIKHSLISKCAGFFWQAFRLYVVCDDKDKVGQLRKEVKSW